MERTVSIIITVCFLVACAQLDEPSYLDSDSDSVYEVNAEQGTSIIMGQMGDTGSLVFVRDGDRGCSAVEYVPRDVMTSGGVIRVRASLGVSLRYVSRPSFTCEYYGVTYTIEPPHEDWDVDLRLEVVSASIWGFPGNGNDSFTSVLIGYGDGEGQSLVAGDRMSDVNIVSAYEPTHVDPPYAISGDRSSFVFAGGGNIIGSNEDDTLWMFGDGTIHAGGGNDTIECTNGATCYCDCGLGYDTAIGCDTYVDCEVIQ